MSTVLFVGGFGAKLEDNYRMVPSLLRDIGELRFYELASGVSAKRHAALLRAWVEGELQRSRVRCVVAHSMGTVALFLACECPRLRARLAETPIILSNAPLSLASFLLFLPEAVRAPAEWLLRRRGVASVIEQLIPESASYVVPCDLVVAAGDQSHGCDVVQGLGFGVELSKRANRRGVCDWYEGLEVHGVATRDDTTVVMSEELWGHMRHARKPLEVLERGGHEPFHSADVGRAWAGKVLRVVGSYRGGACLA